MEKAEIDRVQVRRKQLLRFAGAGLIAMCLAVGPLWSEQSAIENSIELIGFGFLLAGVFGRAWCSLYIGGRKTAEIVDVGPYSISRNPLYVFTIIAMFGVGAQSGSFSVALLLAAIVAAVFYFVVLREEAFLLARFGRPYLRYREHVPRFGFRFSTWRDVPVLEIRPRRVVRTIADGSLFLLAYPLFELLEEARELGYLDPAVLMP